MGIQHGKMNFCSSLETCGVCIDHFCQSYPIFIFSISMLSWNLLYSTSNAEVQSLDPHRSPRQRCLGWGWGSWQRSRGVKREWRGHTTAKQKNISRGCFAKSAGRAESKLLIAHIFPNSSILLAWQCLWNPKTV